MNFVNAVFAETDGSVGYHSDEGEWMTSYDDNFPPLGKKVNASFRLMAKTGTPGKENLVSKTLNSLRSAGRSGRMHVSLPITSRNKSVISKPVGSPIIEDDLEYLMSKGTHKDRVLMVAANDFLKYGMKMSDTEIEDLQITKVTRPKKENSN